MKVNLQALAELRAEKKITLLEMAKALGYKAESTYLRIESGESELRAWQIPLIAKRLGLPVEELCKRLFFGQHVA